MQTKHDLPSFPSKKFPYCDGAGEVMPSGAQQGQPLNTQNCPGETGVALLVGATQGEHVAIAQHLNSPMAFNQRVLRSQGEWVCGIPGEASFNWKILDLDHLW